MLLRTCMEIIQDRRFYGIGLHILLTCFAQALQAQTAPVEHQAPGVGAQYSATHVM